MLLVKNIFSTCIKKKSKWTIKQVKNIFVLYLSHRINKTINQKGFENWKILKIGLSCNNFITYDKMNKKIRQPTKATSSSFAKRFAVVVAGRWVSSKI